MLRVASRVVYTKSTPSVQRFVISALTCSPRLVRLMTMEKLATKRGLYAIIDPEHCAGRDPIWVAKEILAGGCAMMQLRAKKRR
jgi:hypothetical protein